MPTTSLLVSKTTSETRQQLKAAMEAMEQGLEIQGVTAIEDKLQDGVPDALNCLRKAGTKVREKPAQRCAKAWMPRDMIP